MSEDIKIYHVETQEDYDDLMMELEKDGYVWFSGKKPTDIKTWVGKETVVYLNYCGNYTMSYGFMSTLIEYNPNANIIKHKAKGVKQMEKVIVPRCVADWYEEYGSNDLHKTLNRYLNNFGASELLAQWEKSFGGTYRNNLNNVQDTIAKMHLYGYEVEEEKKYYWRKKKEYMCDFEEQDSSYLCIHIGTGEASFGYILEYDGYEAYLTETEVKQVISKEDFNKLERIEIDAK